VAHGARFAVPSIMSLPFEIVICTYDVSVYFFFLDDDQELYSRARLWQMERSNILVVFADEEPNQYV